MLGPGCHGCNGCVSGPARDSAAIVDIDVVRYSKIGRDEPLCRSVVAEPCKISVIHGSSRIRRIAMRTGGVRFLAIPRIRAFAEHVLELLQRACRLGRVIDFCVRLLIAAMERPFYQMAMMDAVDL